MHSAKEGDGKGRVSGIDYGVRAVASTDALWMIMLERKVASPILITGNTTLTGRHVSCTRLFLELALKGRL
jgi:hypothetical protein